MYTETLALFIGGEFCQGSTGASEPLIDPATGETLATLPHASAADLDRALDAAARGFAAWKAMTAHQRCLILSRAADLIEIRKAEIARTLTLENGKVFAEALGEVQFSADATRWYAEEGRRAYGRIVPARMPGVQQKVLKEPVGPVAAFTAWNFPASNAIRKIAGALGAGCSIILKAAEETPGTAIAFARCFHEAGLPAGALNLVFGVPADVSSHLLASPIIKKVSLTGSTAVGILLLKQAAETMKRCTMELGGHAPVIVCDDADIPRAVDALAAAKFRNAGQVCTSPTRFYVQDGVYEAFAAGLAEKAAAIKLGHGLEASTTMGPMIAPRRLNAMDRLVTDAVSKGARLTFGGKRREGRGFFYEPSVLRDVPEDAAIMSEEPFGPLAPLTPFTSIDEVVRRANGLPFGLASFVFTRSGARAARLQSELEAGLVGVNHTVISTPETPFGGVNASGHGSESGIEGLEAYLRTKFVSDVFPEG